MSLQQRVQQNFQHSIATLREAQGLLTDTVVSAAEQLSAALLQGGKVLICGSDGSAVIAEYFVSLLLTRYERERPGLPAIALSADQIKTLAQPNDVLIVLCAGSENASLSQAISTANEYKIPVILIDSELSNKLARVLQSDAIEIKAPAPQAHRSLEVQLVLVHCLCDLIDIQIFGEEL